jgi:hypothetical protein
VTITAHPLAWPAGWKRSDTRDNGRFGSRRKHDTYSYQVKKPITVAAAVERVRAELSRMGLRDDDVVISTNLKLRLDGLPRSDQRAPEDPGAAVYWIDASGATRCMAIDRYDQVERNLAAIAATLEAMRAIERHGGTEILDRAFTGFAALEAPAEKPWHVVLGCPADASTEHVQRNYRRARSAFHPDRGGDTETFHAITRAWSDFCADRGIDEG